MRDIRVVDIPATATAEDVEMTLNDICESGYYLWHVYTTGLPHDTFMRALFRMRRTGFRGNKDGKDEAAIAIIGKNLAASAERIVAQLRAEGLARSPEWVRRKKNDMKSKRI